MLMMAATTVMLWRSGKKPKEKNVARIAFASFLVLTVP
jgi:hypothetical protein